MITGLRNFRFRDGHCRQGSQARRSALAALGAEGRQLSVQLSSSTCGGAMQPTSLRTRRSRAAITSRRRCPRRCSTTSRGFSVVSCRAASKQRTPGSLRSAMEFAPPPPPGMWNIASAWHRRQEPTHSSACRIGIDAIGGKEPNTGGSCLSIEEASMPFSTRYVLVVSMDVDPAKEALFNEVL